MSIFAKKKKAAPESANKTEEARRGCESSGMCTVQYQVTAVNQNVALQQRVFSLYCSRF